MDINLTLLFILGTCYILGSLPSAIIICSFFSFGDPRQQGSGNPGATNVLRIAGPLPAVATLLLDGMKGVLAVVLAAVLVDDSSTFLGMAALTATFGHAYPIFFQFKGGKGVATAIGALIVIHPLYAALLAIIWLIIAILARYASLASLISAISLPIVLFINNSPQWVPLTVLALLIIWRHRSNMLALWRGNEHKITLPSPSREFSSKP